MKRRDFLKTVGAGTASLAMPGIIREAFGRSKLDVAGIYSLSGNFGNVGTLMDAGSKLACEFFGKAGSFDLSYQSIEDGGDPGKAVRKVQELAESNVRCIVGATNSAIGLAVSSEVYKKRGLYVHQAGADDFSGSACNRSSFRWTVPTFGAVSGTVKPLAKLFPDARRWYTITGQYVFGESLLTNTKNVLKEMGREHVGNSYHSLGEREYSGYISSALAAKPDVLVIANFGNQTADVIRQAVSFGMKRNTKILAIWSTGLDQLNALGPDIAEGVYLGVNYWHGAESEGNKQFSEIVLSRLKVTPNYLLAAGFAASQMVIEAVKKANSIDADAVIKAMEGLAFNGPTGEETVRPQDHQVIKDYYLLRGKSRSQMSDKDDYAEVVKATKAFLPVEQTGCVLDKA